MDDTQQVLKASRTLTGFLSIGTGLQARGASSALFLEKGQTFPSPLPSPPCSFTSGESPHRLKVEICTAAKCHAAKCFFCVRRASTYAA